MKTVYILYCLSGFVSLGYQVAWFRILADRFGSTNLTFALVLCNFIGGLGAGSLASRRLTSWISSRTRLNNGLRVYGAVEIMVSATAMLTLLTALVSPTVWGTFPYRLSGDLFEPTAIYHLVQVLITALCVFIPCFLMGVTFPLLCGVFQDRARFPSVMYGWNTLGACSGVLACEFFFLPLVGHNRTYLIMGVINFGLGLYFLLRGGAAPTPSIARQGGAMKARRKAELAVTTYPVSMIMCCAIISGLLTGALEADMFKRLQFLGCRSAAAMSFISFWAILAIFLGSWTVRAIRRINLGWIKAAYVVALVICLVTWQFAYPLRSWVSAPHLASVIDAASKAQSGAEIVTYRFHPFSFGLRPTLLFCGLFVFPTFYLLSLLLPHICNAMQSGRKHLGRLYGLNTVAFCAGMMGFSWIAPRVSIFYSLKLFMWLFVAMVLLLLLVRQAKPVAFWKPGLAVLVFAGGGLAIPTSFDASYFGPDDMAARYPTRAMKSNGAHTTFILEDPAGDRLYFDSHCMSATDIGAQRYMRLMAHFPLLAQTDPRSALLICFGVGNTASAIACHDSIERIDIVELNDKVLETAPEFTAVNNGVIGDPRVRLIHNDGRRFLNHTADKYDLITSKPPPPMQHGVYRLYSREYYQSVLEHLTPGGMMTQWFPIKQMPRRAVELALATFVNTFPHTLLFVGHDREFIALGGNAPIDPANIERRFGEHRRVVEDLRRVSVSSPVNLLARIIKGEEALRREFGRFASISDQRNDLSYLFHDPHDPALITYNPVALLAELDATRLDSYEQFRGNVLHLGRLKTLVRDFPDSLLMSVRTTSAPGVALADVDWTRISRLYDTALRDIQQQRWEDGIDLLRQALRIADELPYVLTLLGRSETRSGRHDSARHTWRRLQALDPDDEDGYLGEGWVLLRMGRHAEAVTPLTQAAELNPTNARAHKLLGDALANLGEFSRAVSEYDKALTLNPGYEKARKNRESAADRISTRG